MRAFAVVLCLVATAASAQPHFTTHPRSEDPLRGPIASRLAGGRGVVIADWDGDGAVDIVTNNNDDRFELARGTGTTFEWPELLADFPGLGVYSNGSMALIDVDANGRLDFVYGNSFYALTGNVVGTYVAQTGDGAFEQRRGAANPFFNLFGALTVWGPSAGDLDGDGLDDLVVGVERFEYPVLDGALAFVRQTSPGVFERQAGAADPLAPLTFPNGFAPSPFVVDGDGDGDSDLVVTCLRPHLGYCGDRPNRYYEQTAPGTFVERTGTASLVNGVGTMPWADLKVIDADGDGDLDVFHVGGRASYYGEGLDYYERTPGGLVRQTSPYSFVEGVAFGDGNSLHGVAQLTFGDADGDGDRDLVVGRYGHLSYLRREASGDRAFEPLGGQLNPFHWVQGTELLTPALGDVDGDGDADLIVGEASWSGAPLRYVEHVGVNLWVERTGAANPFGGIVGTAYPALGDVDGDGDLDLVAGGRNNEANRFRYAEQTVPGVFVERTGAASPVDGLNARQCTDTPHQLRDASQAHPVLADLDADGDTDLVSGRCFFQHIGNSFVPVWTAEANPLSDIPIPSAAGPAHRLSPYVNAFSDVDADGDVDAFVLTHEATTTGAKIQTFFNTGLAVASGPAPTASPNGLTAPLPNPSAGAVRLTLTVDRAQSVRVALYDVLGREVAVLRDGPTASGTSEIVFDGASLPAGRYLVHARGESFTATRQLTVAR